MEKEDESFEGFYHFDTYDGFRKSERPQYSMKPETVRGSVSISCLFSSILQIPE